MVVTDFQDFDIAECWNPGACPTLSKHFGLRSIMATGSYNSARLDTGRGRLVGISYIVLT